MNLFVNIFKIKNFIIKTNVDLNKFCCLPTDGFIPYEFAKGKIATNIIVKLHLPSTSVDIFFHFEPNNGRAYHDEVKAKPSVGKQRKLFLIYFLFFNAP